MSEMREKMRDCLKKYFDHDVVYVSQERRDEALLALKAILIDELVPKKMEWGYGDFPDEDEMSESEGWNACRQEILSKLESLEGPSRTAGKSTENRGQND